MVEYLKRNIVEGTKIDPQYKTISLVNAISPFITYQYLIAKKYSYVFSTDTTMGIDYYAKKITIDPGVTVNTGYAVRFLVAETIEINGTLTAKGRGRAGGARADPRTSNAGGGAHFPGSGGGGGGGSYGAEAASGGKGGDGLTVTGGAGGSPGNGYDYAATGGSAPVSFDTPAKDVLHRQSYYVNPPFSYDYLKFYIGAGGGSGGGPYESGYYGGAGGTGGGLIWIHCRKLIVNGKIDADGGDGEAGTGGAGSGGGGGGAGSAGTLLIWAEECEGTGTISCKGGTGGNGGSTPDSGRGGGGGGAGGSGGYILFYLPTGVTTVPFTVNISGGTGGTGGSAPVYTGGDGATGLDGVFEIINY